MSPKQQAVKPITKIVLPESHTTLERSGDSVSITQAKPDRVVSVVTIAWLQFGPFLKALLTLYEQYRDANPRAAEPRLTKVRGGLMVTQTDTGMNLFIPRTQLEVFVDALLALFVNNEAEDEQKLAVNSE